MSSVHLSLLRAEQEFNLKDLRSGVGAKLCTFRVRADYPQDHLIGHSTLFFYQAALSAALTWYMVCSDVVGEPTPLLTHNTVSKAFPSFSSGGQPPTPPKAREHERHE